MSATDTTGAPIVSDFQRITRTVSLTWAPGAGPRVEVITRRQGAPKFHDAAVISALLTYTWWPENGRWSRNCEMKAVIPLNSKRGGWSPYPSHVTNVNSGTARAVADTLDDIHMPRTRIVITEEEIPA